MFLFIELCEHSDEATKAFFEDVADNEKLAEFLIERTSMLQAYMAFHANFGQENKSGVKLIVCYHLFVRF